MWVDLGHPVIMDDMRRRAERERTIGVVSLVLTLVALSAYVSLSDSPLSTSLRGLVGSEERVRPAVTADGEGAHAFLDTQPGTDQPVGFNPCRPVEYVVNPAGAPRDWLRYVDTAVTEVEDRTGLELTYDGTTDDRDFGARVDGDDPEPVLIAWADEDEVGDLADDVAGVGGPTVASLGRLRSYASGAVVLDRDATDRFEVLPDGADLQVALLLHELGHLVGLDHVDDPDELMYPDGPTRTSYGPGDREGLALLGAIPCG